MVLEYLPATLLSIIAHAKRGRGYPPYALVALLSRKIVLGLSHVHQQRVRNDYLTNFSNLRLEHTWCKDW